MSVRTSTHPAGRAAGGHARVLDLGRLLLGVAIATLGVIFLLDAAGAIAADRAISRWWPVLIVAAGVSRWPSGRAPSSAA